MKEQMTRYLITSALPYINGIKHLGNLIGSILPADVYAKFLRQDGKDVLYICGTDEHGTPAEIAAAEAGKPIEQYCCEMFEVQKGIYERFGIQFDYFGRSSAPSNHQLTRDIFSHLEKNGFAEEKEIRQYYSFDDKRFLPDRYVEGTCPHCGYQKARGDQCDGCGTLLDPEDLLDPYSSISGSKNIELTATKHIFLDLSKLEDQLKDWVSDQLQWPDVVKGIAKKWLNEGLQPRCITRDLKWGVPVPKEGYEEKVFYVWFDAPNGYISMTQDWAATTDKPDQWKEWWMANQDVQYTEFMAKDNVPFHAIFWPAVLFAADMGFKQVNYIKGFHWLTYDKGKFSTSQKRGIFTDVALDLYPADYWRYYLLANCPETSDSDFSFSLFASVVNKDLADILGNFANRTLSLFQKYYQGLVPLQLQPEQVDQALLQNVEAHVSELGEHLKQMKFRQAAQTLRSLWVLGNEYITTKEPWTVTKTDPTSAMISLIHCLHLLRVFAVTSYPFIPEAAAKILTLLNDPAADQLAQTPFAASVNFSYFAKDHQLQAPFRLFDKIEEARAQELTEQYSGK
ncbi:methionine--tRNA ligase [Candidatus Paracaedibacter symbiosus]|uniref:methionine--tRNA ligase n=1 Tax=Candidatus Paracaedibacter symbiosus TaxID=244582 RepID=UPI000A9F7F5E|nr:methionine--tRNA ligase [Candidatus Paracaedibacter symbiosus]